MHLKSWIAQCQPFCSNNYSDVIMSTVASQITSLSIVYSTVYSSADQRKHQSSASPVFVWGIHQWPVNCLHKWPVVWKMFPFDDVIMLSLLIVHPKSPCASELFPNNKPSIVLVILDSNPLKPIRGLSMPVPDWDNSNCCFKISCDSSINKARKIHSLDISLQWCHNERDSISNHQPHDCLFNCLFRYRSKKTSKLLATGLCAGNSPVTGEFPAQRASYAENVSIWWRHHILHLNQW